MIIIYIYICIYIYILIYTYIYIDIHIKNRRKTDKTLIKDFINIYKTHKIYNKN